MNKKKKISYEIIAGIIVVVIYAILIMIINKTSIKNNFSNKNYLNIENVKSYNGWVIVKKEMIKDNFGTFYYFIIKDETMLDNKQNIFVYRIRISDKDFHNYSENDTIK